MSDRMAKQQNFRAQGVLTTLPVAAASFDEPAVSGAPSNGRRKRRRKMSPEARKRISEMMKKRWAERRKKAARS